jgi:hypothetical protein
MKGPARRAFHLLNPCGVQDTNKDRRSEGRRPPAELFDKNMSFLFTGELKTGQTDYLRLEGDKLVADIGRLPATYAVAIVAARAIARSSSSERMAGV